MNEKQHDTILIDIKIDAIKIGMLSNEKTILLIKDKLEKIQNKVPIVLDPVMVAKGGHKLLKDGAEKMLIKKLRITFDTLFADKNKMTLPILLKPSSTFHKDFKILHELITKSK